jgi:serine/threonine protein kinase
MPLTLGTKLGPYEIHSALGAGGMGEVYRATDTRLSRSVAIKVLPSHLSHNGELKQRFEREARAISSLAHPHICTLYDVGPQDGTDSLVIWGGPFGRTVYLDVHGNVVKRILA